MATTTSGKNAADKPLRSYHGIEPGMTIFVDTTLLGGKHASQAAEARELEELDQGFHRVSRVHTDGVDLVRQSKWTPPMRISWRFIFIPASYVTEGRHPIV